MALPFRKIAILARCIGLMLFFGPAIASEYCTAEQFERDHALIETAINSGTLVKGPPGLRDWILKFKRACGSR